MKHYILRGREIKEVDLMGWATFFGASNRIVRQTRWGPFWISTVFLGIDHSFSDSGPPLLFETMVFLRWPISYSDLMMERWSTYDQAELGHEMVLQRLRRPAAWWMAMREISREVKSQYRLAGSQWVIRSQVSPLVMKVYRGIKWISEFSLRCASFPLAVCRKARDVWRRITRISR